MPIVEYQVATGNDDAIKDGDVWKVATPDHIFGDFWNIKYKVYDRYALADIPNGATISSAKLRHCSKMNNSAVFTTGIEVFDVDNMPSLVTEPTAPRWGTTVPFTPPGWVFDVWYDSPDITNLVQHIVNRAGYVQGNFIGFYIPEGDSAKNEARNAYSFDSTPAKATKLVIDYTAGAPPPTFQPRGTSLGSPFFY